MDTEKTAGSRTHGPRLDQGKNLSTITERGRPREESIFPDDARGYGVDDTIGQTGFLKPCFATRPVRPRFCGGGEAQISSGPEETRDLHCEVGYMTASVLTRVLLLESPMTSWAGPYMSQICLFEAESENR